MKRIKRRLRHSLVAVVAGVFLSGCRGDNRNLSVSAPGVAHIRGSMMSHMVGDAATIGNSEAGYESPPIRFVFAGIAETGAFIRVTLRAASAQEGKIAYLKTRLYGDGRWLPLLAVSDKDMRNLPPVSLHVLDDLGNEYRIVQIEPSEPFFHRLYPNESKEVVGLFEGPVVPQAKSLVFRLDSGEEKHEWLTKRTGG